MLMGIRSVTNHDGMKMEKEYCNFFLDGISSIGRKQWATLDVL